MYSLQMVVLIESTITFALVAKLSNSNGATAKRPILNEEVQIQKSVFGKWYIGWVFGQGMTGL